MLVKSRPSDFMRTTPAFIISFKAVKICLFLQKTQLLFKKKKKKTRNKVGVKGTDLIPLFSILLLLLSDYFPRFHTWERVHPYLVFSHCSNANNEPTRHSNGGKPGTELCKVAARISPVGCIMLLMEGCAHSPAPLPPVIWG